MLRRAIESATEHLLSSYKLTGGVENDGEKGAFREFFVSQLIRPLLPHQFGVGSGVVVAADGTQSRQTDVLIFDHRRIPPIFLAGDRGLFPIDSVLAAIEVKSTLAAKHYVQLVEAARRLCPRSADNPSGMTIMIPGTLTEAQTFYPLCAAFAYTADAEKDEFARLDEQVPGGTEFLRVICVLDKGLWRYGQGAKVSKDPKSNAVAFLLALLNKLEDTATSRGAYRLEDWLQ